MNTNGIVSEHQQVVELLKTLVGAVDDLTQEVREISGKMALGAGSSERVSSAEVKTSARGVDVAAKVYAGSPVEDAVDSAVSNYYRALAQVAEHQGEAS